MSLNYRLKNRFYKAQEETYCDIISKDGKVLFAKETTLSEKNIQRLIETEEALFFDFTSVNALVKKLLPID